MSPVAARGGIGGFRVGRLIGRGSRGAVYEAMQLSLDRPVALRLLEPGDFADAEDERRFLVQQRIAASLHHPGIVPTFEAGEWGEGRFVATRYVRGRTLAELIERGEVSRKQAASIRTQLGVALDAAHAAGLVHGRVSAQNVLIDRDGSALLPDLGLGRAGSVERDRAALAELGELIERRVSERRRPRRHPSTPALAGVAALALAAGIAVANGSDGDDPSAEPAPAVAAGAEALGSDLAAGPAASIGCAAEPDSNTPVCTLSQVSIDGRSAEVPEDGVIRGWAVRDATGDLALQVIGRRRGRTFLRSFSQYESVGDGAPHAFATEIRVERGDLVGVTLAPGAEVGARSAGEGTEALRWGGTLPYSPERAQPSRSSEELLLRIDIEPGARPELVQLTGRDAEDAPAGAVLAAQLARAPGGGAVRIELTRVGDELTIDSFRSGRRLARADVGGAAADGRLLSFEVQCGFRHGFCLRWLNEGESEPIIHAYRLTPSGSFRQIG